MKLNSATVLLAAAAVGGYVWWTRRQGGTSGLADAVTLPQQSASGVQLGTASDRAEAHKLAIQDLRARLGYVTNAQTTWSADGRVETFAMRNVRGGTADPDAVYRYEWQPADGAVKRL